MKSLLKHIITSPLNREEMSLRHIAIAAKFLDDNKLKIHLKSEFVPFQSQFLLICQMQLTNFSGVESETTVSKF